MDNQKIKGLKKIFKQFDSLKLVYLFGSQATKKQGELSDHDFAFYIEEKKVEAFQISLAIAAPIRGMAKLWTNISCSETKKLWL